MRNIFKYKKSVEPYEAKKKYVNKVSGRKIHVSENVKYFLNE